MTGPLRQIGLALVATCLGMGAHCAAETVEPIPVGSYPHSRFPQQNRASSLSHSASSAQTGLARGAVQRKLQRGTGRRTAR